MNVEGMVFNRGAVRPLVCLREGWRLIKHDYWLFLGITFVGTFVGNVGPMGLLLGPALCGIHVCLLRQQRGMRISFDMLFRGFDYFAQSLIAALIMMVPILLFSFLLVVVLMVAMVGLHAQQPRNAPPNEAFVWSMIGIMGASCAALIAIDILFETLFMFTFPLIVDRELSGVEAVKMSLRAVFGNLGGVLALLMLILLLKLLGVLLCYFGAIFFLPLEYALITIAYRQVFPPRLLLAFPSDDELPLRDSPLSSSTAIQ